ncbi:MAG: histidine--tRNA ligase [Candidatus Eisenbacteria bacterium]|nr:histidine--tRNA ligase [Candidatus Latescibacterota bacterium]MBD3303498.1 histidine--tRNA ligase [Candidatus Eisenbacteria bacterium]
MKRNLINPVKGTRDFYPESMAQRTWLYERIRAVGRRFGYQEYEGPALEPIALYAAKSGDELVKEQAFVLTDRGGDALAMRPELTPTLARMIAQRQGRLPSPVRWWSFGSFWRYERPQKGRTREFLQWNIDLLGVLGAEADAELVAIAAEFFRETGLDDGSVVVQVNDRALMESALAEAGIAGEAKGSAFKLIDKREKLSAQEWREYAGSLGFVASQVDALAALLENRDLWRESEGLVRLFEALEAYGARDLVEFEPSVIRGLDYYTGTVFEARDRDGEFRAILGGGRYDDLVAEVGGDPVPGVGFAMGDVVVSLVLKKYGKMPEIRPAPTRVLVTQFSAEMFLPAIRIASVFRRAGIETEVYPTPAKMGKQFRYADQQGIPFAVVVGPDEEAAGRLALKSMASGEQETLRPEEAIDRVKG